MSKILFLMIDGFGVPPEGWDEAVYDQYCHPEFIELLKTHSVPIDAGLGVSGIPQSATGQCSLFTGINAAEKMGVHVQGFPGPKLREIIKQNNLFSSLLAKGKSVAFANAYVHFGLEELARLRFRSVTTVMTEIALGKVLRIPELVAGKSVFHDLTRESVTEKYDIPSILPEQAAIDLLGISRDYDFTLFEYFMTDRAGHSCDAQKVGKYVGELSRFVSKLAEEQPTDTLLIMTSDHGNCEDLSTRQHTANPVPFLVYGKQLPSTETVASLVDVHDWIINLFPE